MAPHTTLYFESFGAPRWPKSIANEINHFQIDTVYDVTNREKIL